VLLGGVGRLDFGGPRIEGERSRLGAGGTRERILVRGMPFGKSRGGFPCPVLGMMRIVNGYCRYADSAMAKVVSIAVVKGGVGRISFSAQTMPNRSSQDVTGQHHLTRFTSVSACKMQPSDSL
jgi:hypothetical protein